MQYMPNCSSFLSVVGPTPVSPRTGLSKLKLGLYGIKCQLTYFRDKASIASTSKGTDLGKDLTSTTDRAG